MKRIYILFALVLMGGAAYAQPSSGPISGGGGGAGVSGLSTADGGTALADNAICRADGTTGIQGSALTVSDAGAVATTAGTALSLTATPPAATTGASQAGKAASVAASDAVASTDTAGAAAGGSVTITAGAAARNTSGNANGGDINLVPGAGIGTGTEGQVVIPHGTTAKPGIAAKDNHATGIHIVSGGTESLNYVVNGVSVLFSSAARLRLPGAAQFGWISSTDTNANEIDTILQRSAAGIVKLTNTLNLVPIASPPRTCDATAEGDIYSDTSHALCYCDGKSWNVLTGSGEGSCA